MPMLACAACGSDNPDHARFCLSCGAALDRPAAAHEERKVVSILFVDLVGFTAASEAADPEDVRATLRPYHEAVRADIERFGGVVEKFIGDAVMAVFGARVAHEDDAERAVRAGLRVLETTAELGLEVRAAVNTGEAVVSLGARPEVGESLVAGDVVNTASRLQAAAANGTIVAGEHTYRATADKVVYEELEPVAVKGKAEPVALWRAVSARSRFGVDVEIGGTTPFVGRDRELVLLQETFGRAEQEQAVQLVTIVGEPGVGKTRLLRELGRWLDDRPGLVYWRQGRCLPYGEGVTFWALGEIVKAHAGILETDAPDEAEAKLAVAVSSVIADETEREWVAARLAPLVGLGGESQAPKEESFTAWRQFLEGLAAERPLVLLLEDVHWADSALLEFVDHVLDWSLGVPLLVLCTARPELYERHPAWGGGKRNSTTVSLTPLSSDDTARLLSTLLSEAVLPAETQELLLERCGGNPLYAEQFVRMLHDRGLLERRGRALRIADGEAVPVPETVQALIAARLDTLGPERKAIVQDASVVGKVFWSGVVAALGERSEADAVAALVELARMDLVRPARSSSFEAQREFTFTHLLVRDVAYGQIPRGERARKHRAAAAWIEERVGERVEDHSEQLAHHYGEALALASAAGAPEPEREPLRAAAARFLRLAGNRAGELDARRATELYDRALELARGGERIDTLVDAGRNDVYVGAHDRAEPRLEEAVAAARAANDPERLANALLILGLVKFQLGRPDAGEPRIEAERLVAGWPPSDTVARVLAGRAAQLMMEERSEESLALAERALSAAREVGAHEPEIAALQFRGIARAALGDPDGVADNEEALRRALESGQTLQAAVAYVNVGYWRWCLDGPAAGAAVFREAIEFDLRRGVSASADWARAELMWTLFDLGEWDELLAVSEELTTGGGATTIFRGMTSGTVARVLVERGEPERGAAVLEPIVERAVAGATPPQVAVPALTVAARAALLLEEPARARGLLSSLEEITRGAHRSRATEVAEAARIGLAAGDTTAAAAIAADPYPPIARAEHQHASALAVLAEAAGDLPAALALYRDAAGRWESFGGVYERAHALAGAGRCGGSDDERAEARELFARLGVRAGEGDLRSAAAS